MMPKKRRRNIINAEDFYLYSTENFQSVWILIKCAFQDSNELYVNPTFSFISLNIFTVFLFLGDWNANEERKRRLHQEAFPRCEVL